MSRSATERLFAGTAGFAHRGRHGPGVPENSMAAFRAAIAAGAGIECDLRLSRDGFAMLFHDSSLERMCGIAAETESVHAATLMALPLGATVERIPWLGALLELAGDDTPLLLELKTRAGDPPPPIDLLCRTVARDLARHRGPAGVMSFDPRVGAWFARHAPDIPRGLVIADATPGWRRFAMLGVARPTFLAVETAAAARPWVAAARRRWPVSSWTVRTAVEREALSDRVDALIWEGDGRP
ncbi:glycerophosphoryl diester phosphodiesterase [Sphingomonas kaistensis]|uniref:Glycerophosphoryl diester phosphodiesterase n=1 Tax=Sphingomonas kaistensis TaxID=298708 RepID=A0A7X6BEX8_9SPHN|nr:glycerophosphodiester phosphodiesterase family protein [Sphingomonas kaistensis]NJC04764.1 glycerophosphoryl diester phosphodiesterase [Sphingomonas kaistensis]